MLIGGAATALADDAPPPPAHPTAPRPIWPGWCPECGPAPRFICSPTRTSTPSSLASRASPGD